MIIIILLFFALATFIIFGVGNYYFNNIKKDRNEKHEEIKWKEKLKKIQNNLNNGH